MEDKKIEDVMIFLLYNIKGRKKKRDDWITIAKKCKEATDYFKSYKIVAEKLFVHPETIRSILKLLELPEEVKQLIQERKIGMDAAQRITRIKNPKDQIKAAQTILNLTSHKSRDILRYIQRKPDSPIQNYEKYKEKLTPLNKTVKNINLAILQLDDEIYKRLKKIASKQKISISNLIGDLIKKSLEK